MALTPQKRISKTHIWIFNQPEFACLAGICMMGKSEVRKDVPTACTNGRDKYYGEEFISKLTDPELRFLVLHENYHAAARHTTTYLNLFKQHAQAANIACDHWINLSLLDTQTRLSSSTDIKMPDGGVADKKYVGWSVPQIFKDLMKNAKQGQGQGQGSGLQDNGFDEHDWGELNQLTPQEKAALGNEIDQALRQGALIAGKLKGNMPRELGALLEPKINWREVLADFVKQIMKGKDEGSWSKLNRRFVGQGVYLPSLISNSMGKICIAIDTSGSIGNAEIQVFASELVSICKEVDPEEVSLVWWDSHVAGVQVFKRGEFDGVEAKLRPQGGGGTTPECVNQWLKENLGHECVVLLSDGYVNAWPAFEIPALWALTTKNITAGSGQTLYIDED